MQCNSARSALLLAAVFAAAGCQDLQIDNPNAPDRSRAIGNAADVESLISGTFASYFQPVAGRAQEAAFFTAIGQEVTTTSMVYAVYAFATQQPLQPLLNLATAQSATDPTAPGLAWVALHRVVSNANDGLAVLNDGSIDLGSPTANTRAKAFAKFTQGLAWGQIGLAFDRGTLVDETVDLDLVGNVPQLVKDELRPYPEVVAKAVQSLDASIALASGTAFTLPESWTRSGTLTIDNQELARVANSYAAKFMVYSARTPAERAQVDWNEVLRRTAAGVTRDFGPALSAEAGGLSSALWIYLQRNTIGHVLNGRTHYDVLGPADQSGAWQTFLAQPLSARTRFNIDTPDRRVTGASPTAPGTYFRHLADNNGFTATRGSYLYSAYQWFRHNATGTLGQQPLMSVVENDLIRAEALIRVGGAANLQEAATLINKTRTRAQVLGGVTYQGLPAVTPAGVPTDTNGYCVPRTRAGACGDLMDALIYERGIELHGVDAFRSWVDNRGLGRLVDGAFIHLPIPDQELQTLNLPNYTYGGVGGNCSVGSACSIPEVN